VHRLIGRDYRFFSPVLGFSGRRFSPFEPSARVMSRVCRREGRCKTKIKTNKILRRRQSRCSHIYDYNKRARPTVRLGVARIVIILLVITVVVHVTRWSMQIRRRK